MSEKYVILAYNRITIRRAKDPASIDCDLKGILENMQLQTGLCLCCSIDRIANDLQIPDYLYKVSATQETKEFLFSTIAEYA